MSLMPASMPRRSVFLTANLAAFVAVVGVAAAAEPHLRVFAPGTISAPGGVDCLSFTPDGNTVVFDREGRASSTIMISHRIDAQWSVPEIAPFSGRWVDHDPVIAPDGSYLIFTSNRPDVAGGKPLHGGHLWRVNRTGDGWMRPVRLPDIDNFGTHIYAPAIAASGDVLFQSKDNPSHDYHLYRAVWREGRYLEPVQLQLGPPWAHELDPAIAPDESFIVFDANYAGKGEPDHLYIAYAEGNRWGSPIDLGDTLDRYQPWGSHLGPDGHTLYVTSDALLASSESRTQTAVKAAAGSSAGGTNHIWYVDLDSWLKTRHR